MNGQYDVVFQGAAPVPRGDQQLLLANNYFQWTEEYRVFLTTAFGNGAMVCDSIFPGIPSVSCLCYLPGPHRSTAAPPRLTSRTAKSPSGRTASCKTP